MLIKIESSHLLNLGNWLFDKESIIEVVTFNYTSIKAAFIVDVGNNEALILFTVIITLHTSNTSTE